MTDIVERMKEWLSAQPDPRGRTFHPLHPETLIAQGATEIERLREALRPFAKLHLWPDDLGFELSEDMKADEDWCDDANDAHVDDQWIKRGDIRAARAALGEDK